jgi:protein involved in sex pheromone biosynthesis
MVSRITEQPKTLKDIPINAGLYKEDETDNIEKDLQIALRWRKSVRQEAIKWIKYINTRPIYSGCTVSWIRMFFNITKEDLK